MRKNGAGLLRHPNAPSGTPTELSVIRQKLSTLMRMNGFRRALIAETVLWLALARLALLILPFRSIARWLGDLTPPGKAVQLLEIRSVSGGEAQLAREIGWAVNRMASNVPFKAVCLHQAIAAKIMLRRRGVPSALHFGVAPGNAPGQGLRAHAWLDAAGAAVTGYPVAGDFTEIACFQ
jgi:hypothetical protein